jgi:predicted lipase
MAKVWTLDEVSKNDYDANGNLVALTEDERKAKLIEWNNIEQERHTNKILKIREIRNQKLSETDYLAMSDNVMSDEMKAFRKTMRDIPQDYSESDYDDLLARNEQGQLTHSVWSKP